MNPETMDVQELRHEARRNKKVVAGGLLTGGFAALCCLGMLAVLGAALGIGWLAAFGASGANDLVFYPLLIGAVGVTYYAWEKRKDCACKLEEIENQTNPDNQET